MMKDYLLLTTLFVTDVYSEMIKCYHQKCKTSLDLHTPCDHEFYKCTEYTADEFSVTYGSCVYQGNSSEDGYTWCFDWQSCSSDSYTGKGRCVGEWQLDKEVIIAVSVTAGCFVSFLIVTVTGICCMRSGEKKVEEENGCTPLVVVTDDNCDEDNAFEEINLDSPTSNCDHVKVSLSTYAGEDARRYTH